MFLTYNGINLALVTTDRVNRDTVLSDDGTTVLYVETTLSVSAVYHPPVGGIPNLGGTSVGGFLRNVGRSPNTSPTPRLTVRGSDPGFPGAPGTNTPVTSITTGVIGTQTTKIESFFEKPEKLDGANLLQTLWPSPTVTTPIEGTLQSTFTNVPSVAPAAPATSGADPRYPTSCSLPDPGSTGWHGPIDTDRELELRLRVPRKKMIVWAFDKSGAAKIWIESPRRAAPSDAKNGPVVLNCSVKQSPNGNSFFVSLDIRTWTVPVEDGSDRPLLSHRWHMRHTEDENHYLTREVTGVAVFDVGNMMEASQNPDWFRRQLFHPIPLGFRRRLGPIDLSPDGTTLTYSYADTDETIVFDAWDTGATSIDIKEKVHYVNPWRGLS